MDWTAHRFFLINEKYMSVPNERQITLTQRQIFAQAIVTCHIGNSIFPRI